MDNNKIYKMAIDKWGIKSQLEMLQEESTELSLATRKFIRHNNDERFVDMASEIADVEIMIEQMRICFDGLSNLVEEKKIEKLKRLEKRISENRYN